MKKLIAIIAACVLVAVAVVLLVVFCGCEHEWDRNYDGKCDDCGKILNEVTKDEWVTGFNITNAVIETLETTESSGNEEGAENKFYVVDGKVYPDSAEGNNASWGMNFSALKSYFAFGLAYDSFSFDEDEATYVCESLTVDGITYENISVTFNASKNLAYAEYSVESGQNGRINVSIWVTAHGSATVPEKK